MTASTDEYGPVLPTAGADRPCMVTTVGRAPQPGRSRSPPQLDLQRGTRIFRPRKHPRGRVGEHERPRVRPHLGRFLTPDPNVQFAADLQSYNRYTYAANNPLRYTDPTGYFLSAGFDFFVGAVLTVAAVVGCPASGEQPAR